MRSIRWQLVGSYVLIALLATLVVGGLSLSHRQQLLCPAGASPA